MQELEIGGRKYRTGKLAAMTQFHLVRKLLPVFSGLGESWAQMIPGSQGVAEGDFWKALAPVATAIRDMSNEDSEWIVKTCLATCSVYNGRTFVPITTPAGDLMFDDIDFPAMLNLSMTVIQDNLGNFFPAPQPNGSAGEAQLSPSIS